MHSDSTDNLCIYVFPNTCALCAHDQVCPSWLSWPEFRLGIFPKAQWCCCIPRQALFSYVTSSVIKSIRKDHAHRKESVPCWPSKRCMLIFEKGRCQRTWCFPGTSVDQIFAEYQGIPRGRQQPIEYATLVTRRLLAALPPEVRNSRVC